MPLTTPPSRDRDAHHKIELRAVIVMPDLSCRVKISCLLHHQQQWLALMTTAVTVALQHEVPTIFLKVSLSKGNRKS